MALTSLQQRVMKCLAATRSDTSYLAGGLVLNRDWPRLSDDIDVFHDTDEEIWEAAHRDLEALKEAGFSVGVDIEIYGCVEATVSFYGESTMIQWMSETRRRFFPLVKDQAWGARLHQADLAVNKILAAASRRKARDFVDLVTIEARMCPLGPLMMAAAGKPPNYSPGRILEQIRRNGLSIVTEDYESVKGIPEDWTAERIRDDLTAALDRAETYLVTAPVEVVGIMTERDGVPVEVDSLEMIQSRSVTLRRATGEQEVMPEPAEGIGEWSPSP